ncbi:MAG: hypothetical protein ABIW83_03980 [Allosphingosinicella sp.]
MRAGLQPNAREAVWAVEVIEEIAERGLHFSKDERPDARVRKVVYVDPDGNEIGVGRIPSG